MPYLIFSANGDEIDRRELREPVIIGRAPDCTICIRDILLSRKHCALELQNDAWIVTDLGSRNGTFLAEERVERHILRDGDSLRMGRTWMIFRAGKFVAGKRPDADKPRSRPVDPNEAMAGTVVGFELLDPGDAEYDEAMPVPQPKPREPRSYEREAAGMLNEISSNTWDSTHKDEANQLRVKKSAARTVAASTGARQVVRPKSRVSFDLQAEETKVVPKEKVAEDSSNASGKKPSDRSRSNGKWTIELPKPNFSRLKPNFKFRPLSKMERRVVAACLSVAITFVVCAAWVAMQSGPPSALSAGVVAAPVIASEGAMALSLPVADAAPEPSPVETVKADAAQPAPAQPAASSEPVIWSGAEEQFDGQDDEEMAPADVDAPAPAPQSKKADGPDRSVIVEVVLRALLTP